MPAQPTSEQLVVEQGRLLDYIDGKSQRRETFEEYVRQEIAKSLVEEYGYLRENVAIEFTIRLGSRKPRVDIVVFSNGKPHEQQHASLIVECKSPSTRPSDQKNGVGQLHSYMAACPNAHYGVWTNGDERKVYLRTTLEGTLSFEEIADIPQVGTSLAEAQRPTFASLRPAASDALLFAFRRCHNYIAGNQGLQKSDAFWELLKLIFCKIHDERFSERVDFYVGSDERHDPQGQERATKRIAALFEAVRDSYPQIFKSTEELELIPQVLTYIVSQLQIYSLLDSPVDVKGKAYEEIVGSNLRGDRGEFFTPRNICRMATEMLAPMPDDLILDPACGTGGFLVVAMNQVIKNIEATEVGKWNDTERARANALKRVNRFLASNIVGIDLNPNLVKACKMNMVMNNDGSGGLFQGNSLDKRSWSPELLSLDLEGGVDVILTNPPFGSKIPIDDPSILSSFDLGHAWTYDDVADEWIMQDRLQKSQPPEILFIERCVQLLRPATGRAAIVVPDGILGSPGLGYVRQWILRNATVLASVDLHPDTFQPSTSVQTSLLVLRRKSASQIALENAAGRLDEYRIFMSVCDRVGHDKRGNALYRRDSEGNELVHEVAEEVGGILSESSQRREVRIRKEKVLDDNTLEIARAFREWAQQAD